jgi:hypothetical protein
LVFEDGSFNSFVTVLNSIISLNHPEANLNFLATFLWCILKARNDELFCRKKMRPHQISMHAKDLLKDLEVLPQQNPLQSPKPRIKLNTRVWSVLRDTVRTDFYFTGPKLYVDAASKPRENRAVLLHALGLLLHQRIKHPQ